MPRGSSDRAALIEKVRALNPKGKTPITAAIKKVFGEARAVEEAVTVVEIVEFEAAVD